MPGSQDLYLAFIERRKDPSGVDSGLGNTSVLWTARRTGSTWQAAVVLDDQGQRVRAERLQISISANGEPLVVFRRFGKVGTNVELGQLALTRLASNGSSPAPMYLTDEGRQHWQLSVAINTANDEAVVLSVGRSAPGGALAASIVSEIEPAAPGAHS
jgi:hypothetical protein